MAEGKKAAACLLLMEAESQEKGSKPWAWIRRRESLGLFNLVLELAIEDIHEYKEMVRMEKEQFIEILQQIEPHISRQTNNFVGIEHNVAHYNTAHFELYYLAN